MVVPGSNPDRCLNSKFIILNSNVVKSKALIFLLLFSLLTTTCKKEAAPAITSQSGSRIMVTGQDASAGLKSTMGGRSGLDVSWVALDKIGLYCAQATSNGINAEYTAASTGATSAFTGSMIWGSGTHYFYAYYPGFTVAVRLHLTLYRFHYQRLRRNPVTTITTLVHWILQLRVQQFLPEHPDYL